MKRSMLWRGLLAALVGLAAGRATFAAAEPQSESVAAPAQSPCPICRKANDEAASYPSKAANTLARGASNTLLGWTDFIREPAREVKAGGNVLTGIAKGVGNGVGRTVRGVAELLTFWTPKVQDHYLHYATNCPVCAGQQP